MRNLVVRFLRFAPNIIMAVALASVAMAKARAVNEGAAAEKERVRDLAGALVDAHLRGDDDAIEKCSTRCEGSDCARIVYAVAAFNHFGDSRRDGLINAIRNRSGVKALWKLDWMLADEDISFECLYRSGATTAYLDALFYLVLSGNERAMKRYMYILDDADGSYAEEMGDQLKTLITQRPSLVNRQWASIRGHWRGFSAVETASWNDRELDWVEGVYGSYDKSNPDLYQHVKELCGELREDMGKYRPASATGY